MHTQMCLTLCIHELASQDAFDFFNQFNQQLTLIDNKAINPYPLINTNIETWELDLTVGL